VRPQPMVAIWPRGHGKSTGAELGAISLAARGIRKYGLYVCGSQEQADDHVANVGNLLENSVVADRYPDLAERRVGKYGSSKGWRVNRLWTKAGFVLDAVGLDTASRGVKLDEQRPDFMIVDDIDRERDKSVEVDRKIAALTRGLIPAGSRDLAILMIQNLVHSDSVFARIADKKAGFLIDASISGPVPAVENLEWVIGDDGARITNGRATWVGMNLEVCQSMVNDMGLTAFLAECQHEETELKGGMFDHLDFEAIRIDPADVPALRDIHCWLDPAISSTDGSDCMGIQIDAIGVDKRLYRLWSWEQVVSPLVAVQTALRACWRIGEQYGTKVSVFGIETDQGGDTWESVFREAVTSLQDDYLDTDTDTYLIPKYQHAKAGSVGGKVERLSHMLVDYERGRFRHVTGTHLELERALQRFPRHKPYDLVDAAYWSWRSISKQTVKKRASFTQPTGAMPTITYNR